MNRKKTIQNQLLVEGGFRRIILAFAFTIIYISGTLLGASKAYAAGVPGGNISDPVVRGVDIAKPAVVRIFTQVTGRLTVRFSATTSVTFPQNGGSYKLEYTGSGAFISAHGDILTANHIVQPSPDLLYQTAAPDVAEFITTRSNQPVTANDVLLALTAKVLKSQAQYDTPTMRVYLSTDFTGLTNNATTLNDMPQGTYADVDNVLKTSDFEHGDTAIVHVNMPDTPSIKLGDSTTVEPQDQLTLIGFPGNGDILKDNAKTVADAVNPSTGFFTVSVNKVYVSAIKQSPSKTPLIQVGGNVEHGDSGGPVLDSNGNIVGVASFVGTTAPSGTGFLQASSTAQQMINALQLDTRPGTFQSLWNQAFTQYGSTEAGHWHFAQQQMQTLQKNYPNFHAIQDFLDYATTQASKETATNTNPNLSLVAGIALLVLVVIAALILVLFLARRKKRLQTALATQPPSYQPPYYGTRPSPESQQAFPSSSIAQMDFEDGADRGSGRTPDTQLAQPRTAQSMPQVPQTPTPVSQLAQSTQLASFHATQSGPVPVVPNQAPMNPWPQQGWHESTPAHGQPVPYGQQPHHAAQQSRPAQGMPNPPYPPQQQYGSHPQTSAAPWPPIPSHTPPPPPGTPYAPQNSAQQDAIIRRGQQPPAPYGQPAQGYGAMPQPAQPASSSQQYSASPPAQPQQAFTPPSYDASTMGASPQGAPNEVPKAGEEKRNTKSSIPALSKDDTEIATIFGEKNAPTRLGE